MLKQIPSKTNTQNVNIQVLNNLLLQVLHENCGVGEEDISLKRKRGRKITPGGCIVEW